MRKTKATVIASVISIGLTLSACSDKTEPINPMPTATPSSPVVNSTIAPEPSTAAPRTTEPETDAPTTKLPEPTVSTAPTSEAAAPPATQFAQRWGQRYPNVPEFAILKAANGTCRLIAASGTNWNDSTDTMKAIEAAVSLAGVDSNDALEFAQDADQSYCSSVSNPT